MLHTAVSKGNSSSFGNTLHYISPSTPNNYRSSMVPQLEEPMMLLGSEKFRGVDIRVRVKGGGQVSQMYGTYTVHVCLLYLYFSL